MPDKRNKRLFVAAIFKAGKLRETKGIQNKGNYAVRTILEILSMAEVRRELDRQVMRIYFS